MRLFKNVLSLAAVAAVASACSRDDLQGPSGSPQLPANLTYGTEVSSLSAPVGSQVAVAVFSENAANAPVITLQGDLHFDASRLAYAGQVIDGAYVPVNASAASQGAIKMMALKLPELDRRAATFVFTVKAPNYDKGLGFALQEVSTPAGETVTKGREIAVHAAADLAVSDVAAPMTIERWTDALVAEGFKAEPTVFGAKVAGAGTIYGDVNLSGTVSAADVTYLGNVAVGNITLNDPAANRDGILAGNVAPNNSADGTTVGFGDPCRPGVDCSAAAPFTQTGFGSISSADIGQIAQEAVGIDRPVVGVQIPGKGTTASNRVIIPQGIITGAQCTATPGLCNWTRDNVYQLDGVVQYGSGAVLNIQAGTRIEGNTAINPNALYIRRDAQIFAQGEANAPIVFTCTAAVKTKGCWGGVGIAGNAPVNLQDPAAGAAPDFARNPGGGGNTRILEGPVNLEYGGNNPTDNSGVVRYAIIEYGGFIVGVNNELNNLSLGGVGSGTTIEYVQVHAGLDDGFELFGGTVNARYIYMTANSDDNFDWSFGWQGAAQDIIIQADSLDGDKGLEGDNTEGTGVTFNELPRTNGPIYNFTMVGSLFPTGTATRPGIPANNSVNTAIHQRRGNMSQISNFVIAGYPSVLRVNDVATCTGAATDPYVRNSTLIENTALGNNGVGDTPNPTNCATGVDGAGILSNPVNNNTVIASVAGQLVRPYDVIAPDFRPVAGSTTATGSVAAPPAVNPGNFIQARTYRGAVPPATAATQNNMVWYMGWVRGWQNSTTP